MGGGILKLVPVLARDVGVPARVDQDILAVREQVDMELVGMPVPGAQCSGVKVQKGGVGPPTAPERVVSRIGQRDEG